MYFLIAFLFTFFQLYTLSCELLCCVLGVVRCSNRTKTQELDSLTPPSESLAPLPQRHWPSGSVVQSFHVHSPQPAFPAHNSTEDSTGHHRLIKHTEHSPADVEQPQPSQKIEKAPSLPEEGFGVLYPVHFIINVDPQILIILHNVHTDSLDRNRGQRNLGPPQVHNQYLGLCHIEL